MFGSGLTTHKCTWYGSATYFFYLGDFFVGVAEPPPTVYGGVSAALISFLGGQITSTHVTTFPFILTPIFNGVPNLTVGDDNMEGLMSLLKV
jgi:hypothetical protein